jgi:nucleotide-binding universal stress UspA family protein
LEFTQLAEKIDPDLVLVGSRGLGGARAVLGSVSDMVVHHSPRPVLVASHPLLMADHAALADGPVLVGWDGSSGAKAALAAADRLFPTRERLLVSVDEGGSAHEPPDEAETAGHTVTPVRADSHREGPARAVADALAAYARLRKAALVVVGSRGRPVLREILLGSVAMATLHHAHRPVLVVHQSD